MRTITVTTLNPPAQISVPTEWSVEQITLEVKLVHGQQPSGLPHNWNSGEGRSWQSSAEYTRKNERGTIVWPSCQ